MKDGIAVIAMVAGIMLPLFNIPLIIKLIKRKNAEDFSLFWAIGVWVCIVLMTPQGLRSEDIAFRSYSIVNIFFFSIVVFFILKYKFRK